MKTMSKDKGNPKYDKTIHGKYTSGKCVADVYCVLDAFEVTNPQLQHLTKKALNAGQRGHKDLEQDLIDIRDSAQSALDAFYDKQGVIMLTPEEEYMIRVNTLKCASELLAMVESLSSDLNFVIESYNKKVGDPADFFDVESVHKAQMLLKDIIGE